MKKTNKKGFTIVELVIVIAVIAILAAVLVPNISRLVKKANESSDLSLVRNLNTALAVENTTYATAYEAFEAVKEAGYDLTKIEAKASDNKILFDSANQCFAYLDGSDLKYYPNSTKSDTKTPDHQLWAIVTDKDEAEKSTYSVYWNGEANAEIKVTGVGFDAGEKSVKSVTYTGKDNDARNIVLRTTGTTTVTVDGYVANNNTVGDVIYHYGAAGDVTVTKCASASFHVFGEIKGTVTVKQGHLAVESGAVVSQPVVIKETTGNVKISTKEVVTIVVAENVTQDVEVDAEKTVYIDDRANKIINKPSNAIVPTEISSEDSFTTKENFEVLKDNGMLDQKANVLDGFYKLTANITVEHLLYIKEKATVIIDLNGFSINSTFAGFVFGNWGTLTINDSSNGEGCVYNSSKSASNGKFSHDGVRNFGSLTINNGTFGDNNTDRTDSNGTTFGAAVRNNPGAVCVINGGYFTCVDNYGKWDDNSGNAYSYAIKNFGEMIINDANVYGAMNGGVAADAGHIEINGGKFVVSGKNSYHVITNSTSGGGTTTINDGHFEKNGNDNYLLSGFNGLPSWDASEALASNGYTINGGRFIKNGVEVTMK